MNALILGGASVVTGVIVGVWLMATAAKAAMSHSQRRMQRKLNYWQERAMRAENPDWRRPASRPAPKATLGPTVRGGRT